MFDPDPGKSGCVKVETWEEAQRWNRQGFGIFWTVNEFRDGVRRIDHLQQILAWAVDMDDGTKADMVTRLQNAPLVPSSVIETKRGFQAYWRAKDAVKEHWNALVLDRLVPYFGADKNARDLARILRVPGFLHLKDPTKPFKVRTVWKNDVAYTERQIVEAFPAVHAEETAKATHTEAKRQWQATDGDGFWDRLWNLDHRRALEMLSGSGAVGGEHYTFRRCSSGNYNILVDGKGTSCWIDKHGRIGSLAGGGPTLLQWLKWFGMRDREAIETIKRTFPELDK